MAYASVSLGQEHSCAVGADGTAKCWGSNYFGQVGDGTSTSRCNPVGVFGLTDSATLPYGFGGGCTVVLTGSESATVNITNPGGLSGLANYVLANFQQHIVSQTATTAVVKISTQADLDTRAPYPVDQASLPAEVVPYLHALSPLEQSNAEIDALGRGLAAGAKIEAQVVETELGWVMANITYDVSRSLPSDAQSVYRNRSGVCQGFSDLAVALLRAAGVPARVRTVCAMGSAGGYDVGVGGGAHALVEVYYPDVGWIASDPQGTADFVSTYVLFGTQLFHAGFDQCGSPATVISRDLPAGDMTWLYEVLHAQPGSPAVANIRPWDRAPLRLQPLTQTIMLDLDHPSGSTTLKVDNLSCQCDGWALSTDASWLALQQPLGAGAMIVTGMADASGLPVGFYVASVTETDTCSHPPSPSRVATITLQVVQHVYHTYVPVVAAG